MGQKRQVKDLKFNVFGPGSGVLVTVGIGCCRRVKQSKAL